MRSLFIILLALLAGGPAFAQGAAPYGSQFRVIGKIAAIDAKSITVDSVDGKATLALDAKTPVVKTIPKTLADIQPGDYVGTTTVVGKDGKHRAIEVHIFPKDTKVNLAQFPLEWAPENIMTNAAVAQVTKAAEGTILKVKFPAGETDVIVPPDTPVSTNGPGDQGMLKPGTDVTVIGVKGTDGGMTARRIAVK
jgi:hypothetical protein